MSAHEIYVVMKGTGLSKYNEESLLKILNKGFKNPWYYKDDELVVSDDEIYIYTENKNNNLQKLIKNIRKELPEVDELIWEVKPYWATPSLDEFKTELAYWTKNKEYKKTIYYDSRYSAIYFTPTSRHIKEAARIVKEANGEDYDEDWLASDVHEEIVDQFFTKIRQHEAPSFYQDPVGKSNI